MLPKNADNGKVKAEPGESWKAGEKHILPKNRINIVFFGLMLCIFLAALDQVRVHKCVPRMKAYCLNLDNCRNCFAYNCGKTRRWGWVQLDRQVNILWWSLGFHQPLMVFQCISAGRSVSCASVWKALRPFG